MIPEVKPAKYYGKLELLIDGKWTTSESGKVGQAYDPGTGTQISEVPFATKDEVNRAVESSRAAFEKWSKVPILERVDYLFKIRSLLEKNLNELAELNTQNHGKTLEESKGELQRTIDNVESAISVAYTMSKGETFDQISRGIDEYSIKEPLGVFAIISPFNFPLMVPFWFIPFAVVLGDTIVVKPSEIDPVPTALTIKLIQENTGLPPGVINLIHGSKDVVENLISHKDVSGVTFVGSTTVARQVYKLAGENGKRAIANGGAKNSIVVMPDAKIDHIISPIMSSFFGNAGQRCLAGANLICVGEENHTEVVQKFAKAARDLKVGYGLDKFTEMGPVVSKTAQNRIRASIEMGMSEGAKLVTDGRTLKIEQIYQNGFYLGPTIFDDVSGDMSLTRNEIFGPVASVCSLGSLDQAIDSINKNTSFGNMACIFTSDGHSARKFKTEVNAGNIGINIGVAQPGAAFPFAGRRDSFYGILHPQIDTVDFFTDKKIVISRW